MDWSPGDFLLFLFSLFPALDYWIYDCKTKLKFLSNMFKALAGLAPPFPPSLALPSFLILLLCTFNSAHAQTSIANPIHYPIPSPHSCFLLDLFPLILLGSGCFLISTFFFFSNAILLFSSPWKIFCPIFQNYSHFHHAHGHCSDLGSQLWLFHDFAVIDPSAHSNLKFLLTI